MLSLMSVVIVTGVIVGLVVRQLMIWRASQIHARAKLERQMFDAAQALINSDKLGNNALSIIDGMITNTRNFPLAFKICRDVCTGRIWRIKSEKSKALLANDVMKNMSEDLLVRWVELSITFFIACTYHVPVLGLFARGAFVKHLTNDHMKREAAYKVTTELDFSNWDMPISAAA